MNSSFRRKPESRKTYSVGDGAMDGNYGYLDQIAMLRWLNSCDFCRNFLFDVQMHGKRVSWQNGGRILSMLNGICTNHCVRLTASFGRYHSQSKAK